MGEGTARAGRKDADDNSARDAIEASVRPIPVCAGLALFALFLAAQVLPSIVAFSMSRFRLPCMLFFVLGAALLALHGRRDWAAASGLRRGMTLAVVVALAGFMALDYESILGSSGH